MYFGYHSACQLRSSVFFKDPCFSYCLPSHMDSFLVTLTASRACLSLCLFWGVKITPKNLNLVLRGRLWLCVAVSDLVSWTRWNNSHNSRKLKMFSFGELWKIILSCSINVETNETISKCAYFCAIARGWNVACENIIVKTKCRWN